MSEFRQNLATKEWIILSPGRGDRPSDFGKRRSERRERSAYREDCPFCAGNEEKTLEPSLVYPQQGAWQVRVVPNKFAALKRDQDTGRSFEGLFLSAGGFGIADVVVEHPRHDLCLADLEPEEIQYVLRAYRRRQIEISADERINLVTIFRNYGPGAGTSLEHPHSQIIATPIVPPHVRYPIERAVMYFDQYGSCVYCDLVAEELTQQVRILSETEGFVAFCPYAARSPYECRIYPKSHQASYHSIQDQEIEDLAGLLKEVLQRLRSRLNDPDYNFIIRSAPVGDHDTRHLHWYMVIIPKVSTPAGFEIGSGIYINTMAPEDCARDLREAKLP
jgi:UDPglucose--hexose-1-phosphate uridylyltransferase